MSQDKSPIFLSIETCDCHKRLSTNWIFFPPYVDHVSNRSTSSASIGGIIPPIIEDIVFTCCRSCKKHGKSYVDFGAQGLSENISYNDMVKRISQEFDFSFPVYGLKGQTE